MERVNGEDWVDIGVGKRGFRDRNDDAGVAGTEITADFLNDVQEEVSAIIELADGLLNGATRNQAAEAIRSQAMNVRANLGSADALAITLAPAPGSLAAIQGMPIRIKTGAAVNGGAATLAVNAIAPAAIVTWSLQPLARGDLPKNSIIEVIPLGTQFVLVGPVYSEFRRRLTGDMTVWVRADGNDANDGSANTAGSAFQTVLGAWNQVRNYDTGGFVITIRIGQAGDYVGIFMGAGPANVRLLGAGSATNLECPAGQAYCILSAVQNLTIENIQVKATYTAAAQSVEAMVWAFAGSNVTCKDVLYWAAVAGRANLVDIYIEGSATVTQIGAPYLVGVGRKAHVYGSGRYTNSDGVNAVIYTSTGTITYSAGFCVMNSGGLALWTLADFTAVVATGPRYSATYGGRIFVYGAGGSFLPGSSAGSADSSSFYG